MSAIGPAMPASAEVEFMITAAQSGNTVMSRMSTTRIGLVIRWRRNAAINVRFTTCLPRGRRARR